MNGRLGIFGAVILGALVVLGGCHSRSAAKESAAAATPTVVSRAPCAPPCAVVRSDPCVVSRRPAPMVRPAASAPVQPTPVAAARQPNAPARQPNAPARYERSGFVLFEEDGRLWVFEEGSEALAGFLEKGEPAKRVTRIGVGPDDRTVMSDDAATIDAYLAVTRYAVPGYHVEMNDGRLWVFEQGSEALRLYQSVGEPAKRVTRIGSGPDELSLVGPDGETLDAYIAQARYGRPGFATFLIEGRLWVFREGSAELADFRRIGEPAKRVTRIGSGPDELSLVGPDGETLDAYMATWR